jgi:hypothetical protein
MIDIQRYAGKQAHLNSLFARTALKPTDWLITSKPVEKSWKPFSSRTVSLITTSVLGLSTADFPTPR